MKTHQLGRVLHSFGWPVNGRLAGHGVTVNLRRLLCCRWSIGLKAAQYSFTIEAAQPTVNYSCATGTPIRPSSPVPAQCLPTADGQSHVSPRL